MSDTVDISSEILNQIKEKAKSEGLSVDDFLQSLLDQNDKRSEVSFKELQNIYRSIADNFPTELMAIFDWDLRYVVIGGEMLNNHKDSRGHIEGKLIKELTPSSIYQHISPLLRSTLNGQRNETEVEFNDSYYRIVMAPLYDMNHERILGGLILSEDVTDFKNSIYRQKELTDQLELVLQTARLGVWRMNIADGKLSWNDQQHVIYGISPEEFARDVNAWRDAVHPDDRDYANQRLDEIFQEGFVEDVRFRIVRPDGEIRYLNASGIAIYDEKGDLSHILGVNHDVTDYEKTRLEVMQKESYLRSLSEVDTAYVIRTDLQGCYTYVNRIFFEHFGKDDFASREALLGQSSLIMVLEEDYPKMYEAVDKAFQMIGQSVQVTLRKKHIDGRILWTIWELSVILDENRAPKEIQCIGIDITEQKLAEQALRKSEADFEKTLSAITDYVWMAVVNNGELDYQYYSPVVEKITGYPPEFFLTGIEAWLKIIHPDDLPRIKKEVEQELTGNVVEHEYRIIRADGEVRWLSGTTSPVVNDQGEVIYLSGVVSDITVSRLIEERYRVTLEASLDSFYLLQSVRDSSGYIVDFQVLDANTNALKQTEYTLQEIKGKVVTGFLIFSNLVDALNQYRQVVETGIPFEKEFQIPESHRMSGW